MWAPGARVYWNRRSTTPVVRQPEVGRAIFQAVQQVCALRTTWLTLLQNRGTSNVTNAATWIWFKTGDCLSEGSALIAKFVSEIGQRADVDEVSVRVGRNPNGERITMLIASHPWWKEQMLVHPNGWRGNSLDVVSERAQL